MSVLLWNFSGLWQHWFGLRSLKNQLLGKVILLLMILVCDLTLNLFWVEIYFNFSENLQKQQGSCYKMLLSANKINFIIANYTFTYFIARKTVSCAHSQILQNETHLAEKL